MQRFSRLATQQWSKRLAEMTKVQRRPFSTEVPKTAAEAPKVTEAPKVQPTDVKPAVVTENKVVDTVVPPKVEAPKVEAPKTPAQPIVPPVNSTVPPPPQATATAATTTAAPVPPPPPQYVFDPSKGQYVYAPPQFLVQGQTTSTGGFIPPQQPPSIWNKYTWLQPTLITSIPLLCIIGYQEYQLRNIAFGLNVLDQGMQQFEEVLDYHHMALGRIFGVPDDEAGPDGPDDDRDYVDDDNYQQQPPPSPQQQRQQQQMMQQQQQQQQQQRGNAPSQNVAPPPSMRSGQYQPRSRIGDVI